MVKIKRFDVCLVKLDPTVGSEIQKTRPCVIISPDSINESRFGIIIIAPLTSTVRHNIPTHVNVEFNGKKGQLVLEQLRAIDRKRIVKVLGALTKKSTCEAVLSVLQIMFS